MDEGNGPSTPADETRACLLARLGGESALNSLVGAFYFGVLGDDRLARFFADKDIGKLLRHQRSFLAVVLGTEDRQGGCELRQAHRELVDRQGLDEGHFDAIVEVLSRTLERWGYEEPLRREVLRRVMRFRAEVLGTAR